MVKMRLTRLDLHSCMKLTKKFHTKHRKQVSKTVTLLQQRPVILRTSKATRGVPQLLPLIA